MPKRLTTGGPVGESSTGYSQCLTRSLSRDVCPERGIPPVGVSGPVGPRAILSRPNPSTNPASVVKEERFLASCVSSWGFCPLGGGLGCVCSRRFSRRYPARLHRLVGGGQRSSPQPRRR